MGCGASQDSTADDKKAKNNKKGETEPTDRKEREATGEADSQKENRPRFRSVVEESESAPPKDNLEATAGPSNAPPSSDADTAVSAAAVPPNRQGGGKSPSPAGSGGRRRLFIEIEAFSDGTFGPVITSQSSFGGGRQESVGIDQFQFDGYGETVESVSISTPTPAAARAHKRTLGSVSPTPQGARRPPRVFVMADHFPADTFGPVIPTPTHTSSDESTPHSANSNSRQNTLAISGAVLCGINDELPDAPLDVAEKMLVEVDVNDSSIFGPYMASPQATTQAEDFEVGSPAAGDQNPLIPQGDKTSSSPKGSRSPASRSRSPAAEVQKRPRMFVEVDALLAGDFGPMVESPSSTAGSTPTADYFRKFLEDNGLRGSLIYSQSLDTANESSDTAPTAAPTA